MDAESSILHRVATGDPMAMRDCMERFGGLVWSLARRGGAGAADADDAVQEIFVDLWRSAGRFDPSIATEATFVAMIARRRLIDRGRRRQRRLDTAPLPESVPLAAEGTDPATQQEDAARASMALERLRPEQQRVLQLSIYHGRSHEEIARSTGLPLGTVKTHARRGLIRLREILEAEGALERTLPPKPSDGGSPPPTDGESPR